MILIYHFTYSDYIKFIHNIKQDKYFEFNEDIEKYELIRKSRLNLIYKDIIENLLKDKKRIEKMINKFVESEKILESEEINFKKEIMRNEKKERKSLEYIKFIRDSRNTRILYKTQNDMFYLIIYQKSININLPYNILNYCIKINQYSKIQNIEKPLIVPIVIYLKNDKNNYEDKNVNEYFKITTYDNNIIELKYNLINLRDICDNEKLQNTILEELVYIESLII